MKGKFFIVATMLVATMLMTAGCSSSTSGHSSEPVQSGESLLQVEQETNQENTQGDGISLPTEFRITYEMENGDGTLSLITLSKNSSGDIYYQDGSEEKWFITQGNGYVLAQPDESGKLMPISSGTVLKEAGLREQTLGFWNCAETSEKRFAPGFEWKGTETVSGRTCDLYTNYLGISGMNVTYLLYIDQETGICLKWLEDAETGIFETQPVKGIFGGP